MRAAVTPFRVAVGIVGALILTAVILYRIPSGQWALLPNPASPLAPLVRVEGAKPPASTGSISYVSVSERPLSEFEWLFRDILPGMERATYYPEKFFVPSGSTSDAQFQAARRQMATSQQIAAAVAERELDLPVVADPRGVLVDNVYTDVPAAAKIDSADVILGINGTTTKTVPALHAVMTKVKPGAVVTLRILRGAKTLVERVKTIADPKDKTRAIIGIFVEQAAKITLPVKVAFNLAQVGGPSAGLAFTLEVMRQLGKNVTHGYRIAATGEMHLDGSVTAIGGIKQKTYGVRDAGAQVFLVPVDGKNAKDARTFAGPDLKIIPVTSIDQALRALAALPKLK